MGTLSTTSVPDDNRRCSSVHDHPHNLSHTHTTTNCRNNRDKLFAHTISQCAHRILPTHVTATRIFFDNCLPPLFGYSTQQQQFWALLSQAQLRYFSPFMVSHTHMCTFAMLFSFSYSIAECQLHSCKQNHSLVVVFATFHFSLLSFFFLYKTFLSTCSKRKLFQFRKHNS